MTRFYPAVQLANGEYRQPVCEEGESTTEFVFDEAWYTTVANRSVVAG